MTASGEEVAVDIVIDNYNYGAFLPAAIESARAQSHPRVQVIVVDDGSTDGSRQFLEGCGEDVSVVLKDNGGQASALNAGVEQCEGDVVMFLDADDTLMPDATARVAAAFAADVRTVKVQFRMNVIDAEGRSTGAIKPAAYQAMPSGDLRAAELAYPYDLAWLPTSANAFRVDVLKRILPIPERSYPVCGADWYLNHLVALLGPIVSLEDVLGSYRVHGANSYEPQEAKLDLVQLRQAIGLAEVTSEALLNLADELGLPRPERILSIADLANRLISLRLEPERHRIDSDRRASLVVDAIRATRRRTSAAAALKAVFVAWFALISILPRPLVRPLAERFLFPERRASVNQLLARLQRA